MIERAKTLWIFNFILALSTLMYFIHQNAIDLLIIDRLETWKAVLLSDSFFEGFNQQLGPHRHGLMYVFSNWAFKLSPHDTRLDFYINATVLATIPVLLIFIKRKLFGGWHLVDFLMPWIVLSPLQWETLLVNPYTHVFFPLFSLLGIAILFVPNKWLRAILSLLFVCIGTYSTFAMLVVPVFLLCYTVLEWLNKNYLIFIGQALVYLIVLYFFFQDYGFNKSYSGEELGLLAAAKHFFYMVSYFLGFGYLNFGHYLSFVVTLIVIFLIWKSRNQFLETPKKFLALAMILIPLLIFGLAMGYGRNQIDGIESMPSRYFTALLPISFLIYLFSYQYKSKLSSISYTAVIVILAVVVIQPFFHLFSPARGQKDFYMAKMEKARECILETRNLEACNPRDYPFYLEKQNEYVYPVYEATILIENSAMRHK